MHWAANILGVLIVLALFVLFVVIPPVVEGYLEVKVRPRVPMFWCPKGHGHFPASETLDLFPEMKGGGGKVCPVCYREALKKASQIH